MGHFRERAQPEWLLFSAIVVGRIAFFAFLERWFGGITWGPRYVVPILPFVLLPAGYLLESPRWQTPTRRALVAAVAIAGLVVTMPGVALSYTDPLDVALDQMKATWDQIYFVPRYSPLWIGLRLVAGGQVDPLAPIPFAVWAAPIRAMLLLVAGLSGWSLLRQLGVARGSASTVPTRS